MESLLINNKIVRIPFVENAELIGNRYCAVIQGHNCEFHGGMWIAVN
jgi:hypothetical protein